METESPDWFRCWFGTKYYDLLYAHRDSGEAGAFIHRLQAYLQLPEGANVLDLACGGGRHSAILAGLGFRVTGIDLSAAFIEKARSLHIPGARFEVQDMRDSMGEKEYQAIFNLFTSFGYFSNTQDNLTVLSNAYRALTDNGVFVLDFLNTRYVSDHLVADETLDKSGVQFRIHRQISPQWITKTIGVQDKEQSFTYEEKVQAFSRDELVNMAQQIGFSVEAIWGDYQGSAWHPQQSPRCILICRKT